MRWLPLPTANTSFRISKSKDPKNGKAIQEEEMLPQSDKTRVLLDSPRRQQK